MEERKRRIRTDTINPIAEVDGEKVYPIRPNPVRYATGRKTQYDPLYCHTIVDRMREDGISLSEFAAELNVHPNTVLNWRKQYQEFNDAVEFALTCAQAWWEQLGRDYVVSDPKIHGKKKLNPQLYMFIMKNRFKWADASKVENVHSIENKVEDGNSNGEEISEEEKAARTLEILVRTGAIQLRANQSSKA